MPNFIPENGKNCRNLEEKNNHITVETKKYKRIQKKKLIIRSKKGVGIILHIIENFVELLLTIFLRF